MPETMDDITYTIVRSDRRTADIILERDGTLVVRVPEHVTDERVRELVASKRRWIYRELANWRDLQATKVLREYKNGESFLYLGRSYRLSLVHDLDRPIMLKNGRFLIRRELVENGGDEAAREALRNFYIERGSEKIPPRVGYYAPKVGVEPRAVDVRDTEYRWATITPRGDIAFHWKCIMAPITIIDYIVVHELCHFHHMNHTDAFWDEVDKIMPDYKDRSNWLKKHGAWLEV